jgi:hypothetical protein
VPYLPVPVCYPSLLLPRLYPTIVNVNLLSHGPLHLGRFTLGVKSSHGKLVHISDEDGLCTSFFHNVPSANPLDIWSYCNRYNPSQKSYTLYLCVPATRVYLPIEWVSKKGKEKKKRRREGKRERFHRVCVLKIILRSYSVTP